MLNKKLLLILTASLGLADAQARNFDPYIGVVYDYPEQPSLSKIFETDEMRTLLTDGKAGYDGPSSVWGIWGQRKLLVDWTFEQPVRVRKMEVTLFHPNDQTDLSHVGKIEVYASDGNADFQADPDFTVEVPFEAVKNQVVEVEFPDNGLAARELRTVFVAKRHQCVISEVAFDAEPAASAALESDQQKRVAAQSEKFDPIVFLPSPASDKTVSGRRIFGVCGHMIHTPYFFPAADGKPAPFSRYWEMSYTLPFLVDAGISWSREALYQALFWGDPARVARNGRTVAENRARVEQDIQSYADHNVNLILVPMFSRDPKKDEFLSFAQWIGLLARKFPNIRAVELHNEPNLKGFWKGTPAEFVTAAKAFAGIVKGAAPQTTIIAGSFSGWGGAWQQEDLKQLISGPKDLATRWAEEVFKLGLLDVADAVSAHPYRCGSAPEGGEALESPRDPEGFAREIRGWLELVAKYSSKPALPFYITEIGYSVSESGYSRVPSEERQADYLSRIMLLLFALRLEGVPLEAVCWYDLKQDETRDDPYEANFGLISPDTASVRPAYLVYRRLTSFFSDPQAFHPLALPATFQNGGELIKSYSWKREDDGSLVVAFWRMNQLQKKDADFASEITVSLPEGFQAHEVILYDLQDDRPRSVGFRQENGRISIPVQVTARTAWLVMRPPAKAS